MSNNEDPENGLSQDERTFAREVRRRREERGWSQAELLKLLHNAGLAYMNQTALSRLENGTRPVRMIEGVALARAFQCSIADLLHPDKREPLFELAREGLNATHRSFAEAKDAARAFIQNQRNLVEQLEMVEQLYPNMESEDPESLSRLNLYFLNANNMVAKDIVDEVRSIAEEGQGNHG